MDARDKPGHDEIERNRLRLHAHRLQNLPRALQAGLQREGLSEIRDGARLATPVAPVHAAMHLHVYPA